MRHVYENIELIREARGISQTRMAEDSKVPVMMMHRWLTGQSKLPADAMKPIAKSLLVSDIDIFFDDELTDSVTQSH
ncbi:MULTISPECIES: helix-turn-helix domain-containing protein [unclassified Bilifractor]|uniref:helix-turn-helix domain-containing protein n=1 Tax=unclassified Bilifractor TaxID=2815795 RepID=UPI003F8FDBB7